MTELSDYKRIVSDPLEKKLRATIQSLSERVDKQHEALLLCERFFKEHPAYSCAEEGVNVLKLSMSETIARSFTQDALKKAE